MGNTDLKSSQFALSYSAHRREEVWPAKPGHHGPVGVRGVAVVPVQPLHPHHVALLQPPHRVHRLDQHVVPHLHPQAPQGERLQAAQYQASGLSIV